MLNWESVRRTGIFLHKNVKYVQNMQTCKNISSKNTAKMWSILTGGKNAISQQKLNQQDFVEGDGAREKHKKEIHLEGARQVSLFLDNIKIIKKNLKK